MFETTIRGITEAERERLVRLCAYLSGSSDAAEDLAQETLLEAWRNVHKLHDPAGRERWLAAIARNVCLRWARRSTRGPAMLVDDLHELELSDSFDLEADLDRRELCELLERALALLPVETRQALVEHHVNGRAQADIAARSQTSEAAVSMRLTRGRRALRRLLATELREDAAVFGLIADEHAGWRETRVWCAACGRSRLWMQQEPAPGAISFRCPCCQPEIGANGSDFRLSNQHFARLLDGRRQPWRILRLAGEWSHAYFRQALVQRVTTCTHCGQPVLLRRTEQPNAGPHDGMEPVLFVVCSACHEACSTSLSGLVQAHPALQQFWREEGRIRALPITHVEHEGCASLVVRYESVPRSVSIDLILTQDRFEVLAVHPPSPARPV